MKPLVKPMVLSVTILIILLFIFVHMPIKAIASNPIYATLAQVQQMIANALSPVQSSLNSLTTRVSNLEATATPIPGQIADLQNHQTQTDQSISSIQASLSAQSNQSKAVLVFDANGQKLGILLNSDGGSAYTIFIPSVNKIADIDGSNLAFITLEYTTTDCTGMPYNSQSTILQGSNKVVSTQDGSYYTIDSSSVPTETSLGSEKDWNSSTKTFSCRNIAGTVSNSVPLVPVTLPFSEPFATPLQLKYQ